MARIDSFLRLVAEQGASDLHFHAGNPPLIRHDGEMVTLPFRKLSREESKRFIVEILSPEQKAEFEREKELDFMYIIDGVGRFRGNCFVRNEGYGAVFRIIPTSLPTPEDLMVPAAMLRLTQLQNGLVLICGPTGSGKTTTLAALVNHINQTTQRHIITVEDPIEFIHTPAKSAVTQRQVGKHVSSFAAGLRSALRESPDVLVVGEMRDEETITLAVQASETGVLVFGTLHTNSSSKALDRILDSVKEEAREQMRSVLSVLLRAVVAQHLVRKSNSDGRVAAFEILLQNYAVSNMIREGKLHQLEGYLQSASHDGSGTIALDYCLLKYIKEGQIALDEAVSIAAQPDNLRAMAAELGKEE